MKLFNILLSVFLLALFSFYSCLVVSSMEEEVVFELKREKKRQKEMKRKKATSKKFNRQSFSYSKDFVVFNEDSKSALKPGSVLKVNIPYPLIASFDEEFPIYGIVVSPFKGIVSGKIKAVKSTNRALISFDEVIVNNNLEKIKSIPVFLEGDLKESLFKDIALNFFDSLPSVLALALRSQLPQSQIHFINTDLKGKMGKLSVMESERRKRLQYLEIPNIKLFSVVIK